MSATTVTIRELHPKQLPGSGALAAMVAVAAGLTIGPLLSGVLATVTPWPTVAPFILDIVLAVALALALLRIPETRPAAAGKPVPAPVLQVPASIRRTWAATTLASAPGWMFMGWILGLSPSFLHEQLGVEVSRPIVAGLFAGAVVLTNGRPRSSSAAITRRPGCCGSASRSSPPDSPSSPFPPTPEGWSWRSPAR